MTHQMIDIAASDASGSFQAYLSLPPSGKGPGLVIAQEIFGVNQTMRDAADAYAAEGYVVLVPDLFWRQEAGVQLGYTPADWQRAFGYYQGFSEDKGVDDIQASLNALRVRPECVGEAGVLGFCLGGKLAYLAACRTDAAVSVSYYGVGIEKALDEATQIKGRLVLHIAENDQFCPAEARSAIVAAMSGRADTELYVYPGVDHAFARAGGEHFDAASAAAAHERSMAALKSGLGPG
jgi:carboxymethylenebutenolidase